MDYNLLQNMLTFCNKIVTTCNESDRDLNMQRGTEWARFTEYLLYSGKIANIFQIFSFDM